MSNDYQKECFDALEIVALIHRGEGRFAMPGSAPAWFNKLCPDLQPGELTMPPGERFPFLINFIVDALAFWKAGEAGRIRSGLWIETAPDGDELALEASALRMAEVEILIIESCQYAHSEKQSLIQTGRQLALDIHQHQRRDKFNKAIREELEAEVRTRTAALQQANARLKAEVEQRHKAQHSLAESERRFRVLFDNLFDAQLLVDVDGRIRDVNQAACRLLSRSKEHLHGGQLTALFPEHEMPRIRRAVADAAGEGAVYFEESILLGKEGLRIPVEGGVVGLDIDGARHVAFSLRDISYRKQLQTQLQQSQKMEAIGSLASGISHDFNNILSAIIGYTEIVRMDLDQTSQAAQNLGQVLAAGNRAKELVEQILTFSRQTETVNKPVQIHSVVSEALKLIRATLPANIQIRDRLESRAYVRCDPTQIHQVCLNLFSNAGHAMEKKGGDLDVLLKDVDLEADIASIHPELEVGPYVRLSVVDTGEGIPEASLVKIFDPFYTTKGAGKGTGMGLSVVHGIVTKAGGAITVDSHPGQGCCFTIYLPLMNDPVVEPQLAVPVAKTGTERILFVDDEIFQADLAVQTLGRLGYRIDARTSSHEALALFEEDPDAFDLVITDLTMPQLAGTTLAKKMHELRPDLPIILISGFSSSISTETACGEGFCAYLNKPLVTVELANAVREVLDGKK